MSRDTTYTLEEIAGAFDLTPRTARHYIENVLPPHHKTGRGRLARYGQDTWNCFAFIRKARGDKLTMAQIARLLGELGQRRIDRVVRGLEQLSIVPTTPPEPPELYSSPCMAGEFPEPPEEKPGSSDAVPRWQVLYADNELQISHRGKASPEQRGQVRMAAAYIKRIFGHDR